MLIGCVGKSFSVYGFYVSKNSLENVPARVLNNNTRLGAPRQMLSQTMFYK